jgi:hypothetical protein
MKTLQLILLIGMLALNKVIQAQSYTDLYKLESPSMEVYYSSGFKE